MAQYRSCPNCNGDIKLEASFCLDCGISVPTLSADLSSVGFFQAIKLGFVGCFNFRGRSRRSEFWRWILFLIVILLIPYVGWSLGLILMLPNIAITTRRLHDTGRSGWWQLWMAIYGTIATGIAGFAVVIGLFVLGSNTILAGMLFSVGALGFFVLFVLIIIWIVWLVEEGDEGSNRYGPNPKLSV